MPPSQQAPDTVIMRRSLPGRRLWRLLPAIAGLGLLVACSPDSGGQATTSASSPRATATSPHAEMVPVTVVRHGRAVLELVPVFVDGHGPYMFILDTGSSISSVSGKLATALNLPQTGRSTTISGVVTSTNVPIVSIRTWKLGRVALVPDKVAVVSGSPTTGSAVGLLGSDELSRFSSVVLDFAHSQLRLTPIG